jgi:PAS domain S-box-containing protein
MYRLYGLRKEDFSGAFDAWAKSLAPEDFDRANDNVQAALRGEREFGGEFRIVWPDGSVHYTKAASQTFRDETGRSVRMVGVNYDITKRKQAEEALRESEEKFRVLTETAASGILIYQDDKYRYANRAAEGITGYSKDEILEMGFGDLEHSDFRELAAQRTLARQRGEDVPSRYEVKIVDKNGNERWLDAANSFMEFQGKPAILITAFDITERKRAEHALQRNEDLFRAIVEDQTEMIVRWKPDGTRTFVNQAYCRVFGGDPKDFIGTSFYPQVAEKYRESIQKKAISLTPAKPLATETHLSISANGQEFWQEWTDRGIFDAQGNLVELQSTGRDITERRRAEEALRESERRLKDTLTNIDMIAVMADINGDITFCNDYLLRLTNWKREEAIGRNWFEMFLPEGEKERVSGILGDVEQTGEVTIHLENEIKTRSGERRLVKWTNTTLRGLNGNVIGLAALGDDITERKQAEQLLKVSSDQLRALSERLRRAKEEEGIRIARELHDELGSALTSLKWSLLGLDKAYPGSNNSEGHSDTRVRIEEMVGLVDATVNTVRRISSELRPGVLDDLGLVSAIEWHAQQLQEQTGMVCQLESHADSVELDRDQATVVFRIFQEAMTNILRHAQATKTNILIEEEDGDFVLEITDNGRGITESEKLGIRSLGLLGMRERANSIGARIVISGIPGKGTRLIVRLPLNSGVAV